MKKKEHNQPVTQLPIHFKKPGRSYSQIGRKGNIALYQVFSDYLIIPDFAQPYLTIGYELIVVKHDWRTGNERYPRANEFGQSGWSIPKSFFASRLPRSRMRSIGWSSDGGPAPKTVLDRSAAPEDCACQIMAAN